MYTKLGGNGLEARHLRRDIDDLVFHIAYSTAATACNYIKIDVAQRCMSHLKCRVLYSRHLRRDIYN